MSAFSRPERDARRLDEAQQLRDDRAAQNPSWVAWKNLWDRLVYGTAINAATWRHENSRPCPSCGTMLSPPWRHP